MDMMFSKILHFVAISERGLNRYIVSRGRTVALKARTCSKRNEDMSRIKHEQLDAH